jgi:hypothetical protein
VRLDDGAADRKPDPHPRALGGHERLKQLLGDLGADPRTGVRP